MIIKYYKNDKVKKAIIERNLHIVNNWIRLNFKCSPQAVVNYDSKYPFTGSYVGVECNCGKIFYQE